MHVYHAELATRPAPRYTSYPTALAFSESVGAEDWNRALAAVPYHRNVSLYVHIPYCHQICWYCGCNTGAIGRPDRLDAYVAALEAEIATVGRMLNGRIAHVHFGGGSPNALPPALLQRLTSAIRQGLPVLSTAEWAAELDPRLLDADYAQALADAGMTRVSLGAQTFTPLIQSRINRLQPFRDVARRIEELRAAGIRRINLDLMYGLPGQTLDDIASTLAGALTLAPDRVAMFGYAHLPRLLPRQRMIDTDTLPGPEARFWQSALAHDLLVEAGYDAIGFDHFAQPDDSLSVAARRGRLRRNFQGFTDDQSDVLVGIGASAISQFPDLIVQNDKHVGRYRLRVGNGVSAARAGVARSSADRMYAEIIETILCRGEIDLAAIAARHARSVHDFSGALAELDDLTRFGIVARHGSRIAVTEQGRPYARLVAQVFDRYRAAPERFSRAV